MSLPYTLARWGTALSEKQAAGQYMGWYDSQNLQTADFWGLSPALAAMFSPQKHVQYFDHFTERPAVSETANAAAWLMTVVDGGTDNGEIVTISDDEPGGWLSLTTNDADNDLLNLQLNGEAFKPAAGKDLWFECKFKVNDSGLCDFFIGLADTNTGILAAKTNILGFQVADGTDSEVLSFIGDKATAEDTNVTSHTMTDDTAVIAGFYVNGITSASAYIAGVAEAAAVNIATANVPVVALTPSIEIRNASGAASVMEIDYIRCIQQL